MNLPKVDKKGSSYISYSQITTFKRSREDYYNQYILKVPFEGNAYTDFGNKVGSALGKNDYSKFSNKEANILSQVTRLDCFERMVKIQYKGFYLIGFIDSNNDCLDTIIDYKTGGREKEFGYMEADYNQLQVYALAIRQETGVNVKNATVEFIRREGNAYRGQKLTVANEKPIVINQDLSEERLKHVYWDVLRTTKEIEEFYKANKTKSK